MLKFAKLWRKYFIFAGIFSLLVNILSLTLPLYILVIYDRVLYTFSQPTLVTLSLAAVFSLCVLGLFDFFRSRLLLQAGIAAGQTLYSPLLEKMYYDASRFDRPGYRQGLEDVQTLRRYLASASLMNLFDIPFIPIFLFILFCLHPWLSYIALAGVCALGLLAFLQHLLVDKRLQVAELASSQEQRFVDGSLDRAELVHSQGMLPALLDRCRQFHTRGLRLEAESDRLQGALVPVIRTLRVCLQLVVYGTGVFLFFSDALSAGMLIASVLIVWQAIRPVEDIVCSWKETVWARAAYTRLRHFLHNTKHAQTMELPAPQGRLDLEGGTLALAGTTLLRNISFSLSKGEHLGVIGSSASGKTALCRLVLGYWPAVAGKVRLDGADILQWDRKELGGYLGYLPQELSLFPGTISENIARLDPVDPDKVVKAAQAAGAHQMILHLPQGYDTVLDSSGTNLSVGQRQRISLARALYNDPVVVVLDQPEIGLDDEGEKILIHCLAGLKKSGTTVVITSHKPRIIQGVDKVLMLKDGQMALFGPRQEVLKKLMERQKQQQGQQVAH
jgi:PrtD family type I secretion system ABC transporter